MGRARGAWGLALGAAAAVWGATAAVGEDPLPPIQGYQVVDGRRRWLNAPVPGGDDQPRGRLGVQEPLVDLVLAVLVVADGTPESDEEMNRVRAIYDPYGGVIRWVDRYGQERQWNFKVAMVCGNETAPAPVPKEGLVVGDMFYTNEANGYTNLERKVLMAMGLFNHYNFRFVVKTDSDSIPCLTRIASMLEDVPPDKQRRIYAGKMNTHSPFLPEGDPNYDPHFQDIAQATMSHYPLYMAGAFYILGRDLAEWLHVNKDNLEITVVEDAMMGVWLLGVQKVVLGLHARPWFHCPCARYRGEAGGFPDSQQRSLPGAAASQYRGAAGGGKRRLAGEWQEAGEDEWRRGNGPEEEEQDEGRALQDRPAHDGEGYVVAPPPKRAPLQPWETPGAVMYYHRCKTWGQIERCQARNGPAC